MTTQPLTPLQQRLQASATRIRTCQLSPKSRLVKTGKGHYVVLTEPEIKKYSKLGLLDNS